MTYANKLFFCLGIASLLLVSAGAHDFIQFGYGGANGPDQWGSLSSEFQLCSRGQHQSPINIVKNATVYNQNLGPLNRDYVSTKASLVNNGFSIELRYDESAGKAVVDGKNYSLTQMIWHSPSEHLIDGERFPVELQLIHKSDDGCIAVVAILYQYGHPDAFLLQIKDEMEKLAMEQCSADQESQIALGVVQTRALKRRTRKYFRYVGSLTTPPCTETVTWNILGKVREMTKEQANLLQAPLSQKYRYNARPVQPLNGRSVQLFDETLRNKKPS
ncbi:bifunctional monodehydroascorbate reductase and carbonic [Musa troglodytarum]|uniref:Bifunctional monodehydroascorbate reductase and carbonic n=1 Tax=Musa troglodytarum TaxID=320322 RepID=A0A9E7F7L1_9LILI|nr:bifunctional monodehydroascorbate reductase and carbonic [Musa troglodytarum]